MATYSDNFNRADGDIGADYDTLTGLGPMLVVSNAVNGSGAVLYSANAVKISVVDFTADQEATITYTAVGLFDFAGPGVRMDAAAGTGYVLNVDGLNSATRRLARLAAGAVTIIGTKNLTATAGDVLTIRALGTTIAVFKNGTLFDAVVDTTYADGQPGMFYNRENANATRLDNFSATDVTGVTTVIHTIASAGGDYTSLSAWEAAQQRDLTTAKALAVAECSPFIDTTAVVIDGWTTSATQYIEIRAAAASPAKLPFDSTGTVAYLLRSSPATNVLDLGESYTRVRRIQIQTTNTSGSRCIATSLSATGCVVDSCILSGNGDSSSLQQHHGIYHTQATTITAVNCVAINLTTASTTSAGFNSNATGGTFYAYNCTAISAGAGNGFRRDDGTFLLKNCLASGFTTGFTGFFSGSSTNNASTDATAPGSNARNSQTFTFASAATGDYRLSAEDTGARGFGTSLVSDVNYALTTDFNGYTRPVTWDIGASQSPTIVTHLVASSGGAYTSLSAWEAAQQRDLTTVNEIARASCAAFQDTTAVIIDGWTTDVLRYVQVIADAGAEAQMPWSTNAYRLVVNVGASSQALFISDPYTRIERIQVEVAPTIQDSAFPYFGVRFQSGNGAIESLVDRCHVRGNLSAWSAGSTTVTGIYAGPDTAGNLYVRNTVVTDFIYATAANAYGLRDVNHTSGKTYVYNCTFINCGRCLQDGYSDVVVRNTLTVPAAGGTGYVSGFDAASSNNASSDATAVGSSARQSQTFAFVSAAGGDYRVTGADTGAKGFGVNLTADSALRVTADFFGAPRTVPFDIGAARFVDLPSLIKMLFRGS